RSGAAMVAEWYCEIEGQRHGPLTAVQLKQLATSGKLQPAHAIWKNGMQKKVPAKAVKGLFDGKTAKTALQRAGAGAQVVEEIVETDIVEVVETDLIEEIVEAVEPIDAVETVETVDTVEEIPDKPKKKKKEKLTPAQIIGEVSATYREGHPDLEGPISG